jgi:hypothetical protein
VCVTVFPSGEGPRYKVVAGRNGAVTLFDGSDPSRSESGDGIMRCEQCGRDMKNAELWQLATDPKAPTSWSMKQLCWDCREHPERAASSGLEAEGKLAEEVKVVSGSQSDDFGDYDTPPQ